MFKAVVLFLLLSAAASADVGTVTEFQGTPAEAVRHNNTLPVEMGFSVEMLDRLITANSRMAIVFEDDTRVELTEQSQLTIDDFVYDPATSTGQMAMNVMSGTVQMASGRLAQNSRDSVNIRTPTAAIAIRGTDFSMTVDEIGRSLIVLLPSCGDSTLKEEECPIGSIEVSTQAGSVILNSAFESTLVVDASTMPGDPRRLLLGRADINNMLIITPPPQYSQGFSGTDSEDEYTDALSEDLLADTDLDQNLLEFTELSSSGLEIDRLASNFLDNVLGTAALDNELAVQDQALPNIGNFKWIDSATTDSAIQIRSERPPHIAMVTTDVDAQGTYDLTQDGVNAVIQLNNGGTDVFIRITQTQ